VLAFLGAGYTHESGPYADNVARALRWLVNQQRADGFLGGQATHYEQMYCHAMASYALAEAYAMRSDPKAPSPLRQPLERAIQYILDMQNEDDGGWRYQKGQPSDMSIFGWNLCRQMMGQKKDNPASREAVTFLLDNLPRRADYNLYYWYYGTLAMYQYGGAGWEHWNDSLRDLLVKDQQQSGPLAGSWDPNDRWGGYGGRVYSTAMGALSLEVYYRFLPLYRAYQPGS
jgi:hypothetical protein